MKVEDGGWVIEVMTLRMEDGGRGWGQGDDTRPWSED